MIAFLKGQRDFYEYLHDQTLRLANHGYTGPEIAEVLTLPDSLGEKSMDFPRRLRLAGERREDDAESE